MELSGIYFEDFFRISNDVEDLRAFLAKINESVFLKEDDLVLKFFVLLIDISIKRMNESR